MKEVKVNKSELLTTLRANLTEHQSIFEEALDGYKKKVIEILERKLADARAGKRIPEHISIPMPVNQSHEYKRTIRMLEMSVEDTVTLTAQEFDMYVMDRWQWKQNFLTSNSAYSAKAMTITSSALSGDDVDA